jgi:hypothetical protein
MINMGLRFTGIEVRTIEGVSLQAKDTSNGKTVFVKISDEAIQDHGMDHVKNVGERKYDHGDLELDGTVIVRSSDCSSQSR